MVKTVTLVFAAFSNNSLGTSAPNLLSLTRPSLQILCKTQVGAFLDFWSIPYQKNYHNSELVMIFTWKLGPLTKLETRNRTSKKFDDDVMSANRDFIVIFFSITSLEQSGSWVPNASSIELTFSFIVTFYLAKTENRTKKPLTQHSRYCF